MTRVRAFERLNLAWNPFSEPEPEERPALALLEVGSIVPRDGEVVQLVGESGRGKTTHLLAVAAAVPGAVYHRVDERDRRLNAPEGAMLLLDEAQRMSGWRLRRLLCRSRAAVLGTHVDLSRAVRRPVRTIVLTGLGIDKLAGIVDRRIGWARRGPGPVPRVPPDTLVRLLDRHGDDLRAIEGALYEAFQRVAEGTDVEL